MSDRKGLACYMKHLKMIVMKTERYFCGIMLAVMLIVVFLSTVGRYTGLFRMSWGDEAARYCMLWTVFIGSGYGALKGELFNVSVVADKMPPVIQKAFIIIRTLIVIIFCGFTIYYGILVVNRQIMMLQTSPSLKIPMWIMYACVPVGGLSIMIHYIAKGIIDLRKYHASLRKEDE